MIEILMATYNGERYLAEQLDSLFAQTETDWHLTVRDDGSTDRTAEIVGEYAARFPEKITFAVNEENSGGARYNFYRMLTEADADYVMTCDQDDIWLPDKIGQTLRKMRLLEQVIGAGRPVLVHTDLTVVDQDGEILAQSMFFQQNLDEHRKEFSELLVQNNVTGCTVMVNRALLNELPKEAPDGMIMHDWWMALVAAAFGEIGFVRASTIRYRQHADNAVGAKDARSLRYQAERLKDRAGAKQVLADTYRQAAAFAELYRGRLTPGQLETAETYGKMESYGKLRRLRVLRNYRLWKHGLTRRIGQMLFC